MNTGTIVQVAGPVVDVAFPEALPAIYNALTVRLHVDRSADSADTRSAAAPRRPLGADGLDVRHRGPQARLRGHRQRRPIKMPVGEGVMGRIFDVTGNPVDERGPVGRRRTIRYTGRRRRWPISRRHRRCSPPASRSSI